MWMWYANILADPEVGSVVIEPVREWAACVWFVQLTRLRIQPDMKEHEPFMECLRRAQYEDLVATLRQLAGEPVAQTVSQARGAATKEERRRLPPCRHSQDFRSVHWYGQDFTFTATQAACVKVLWESQEQGTPAVGQECILEQAGSEQKRLVDLFKSHPAWGTMIVRAKKKGAYQLAEPPAPPA
jgi:hypothetical protein